jgi:hypothetical protein
MKGRAAAAALLFLMAVVLVSVVGCASKPTDAQALKAIEDSGILKSQSFTITSPLTVVERGEKKKDGSWPVRVKMTLTMTLPNGTVSEPKENDAWFRIFKGKDSTGHSVWKAALGS